MFALNEHSWFNWLVIQSLYRTRGTLIWTSNPMERSHILTIWTFSIWTFCSKNRFEPFKFKFELYLHKIFELFGKCKFSKKGSNILGPKFKFELLWKSDTKTFFTKSDMTKQILDGAGYRMKENLDIFLECFCYTFPFYAYFFFRYQRFLGVDTLEFIWYWLNGPSLFMFLH